MYRKLEDLFKDLSQEEQDKIARGTKEFYKYLEEKLSEKVKKDEENI